MRAAIYCRVSTDVQGDNGTSLDTQQAGCRAYCGQHGHTIVMVESETASGAALDRPALQRVRDAVKEGVVEVVVIYDLDRLSRSQNHHGVLFCEIEEQYGARIESATQDANSPTWKIVRSLAALLAEMERDKIRERTQRGRNARIAEGNVPTTGFAGYGFAYVQPTTEERKQGKRAHRVVVEPEAGIVREIYEAVAAGHSLRSVAAALNERGVPSPGSRLRYEDGCSGKWTPTGLRVLLRNPAYKGLSVARRFRMKTSKVKVEQSSDEWTVINTDGPVIVDAELWRIANERLQRNRGAVTWNKGQPMLLRGRVLCGECGGVIYAGAEKRRGRKSVYRCRNKHDHKRGVSLHQAELDEWVWSETERVLQERDRVVAALRTRLERSGGSTLEAEAERLEERAARAERQKAALLRQFTEAEGSLPWATIQPEVERLERDHAEASKALSAVREKIGQDAAELARLDLLDAVVRRLGPRLADPDHDTKVQVINELGLTVTATKLWQQIEWSIPLADGDESGWGMSVDLTGVTEPDEITRRRVLEDERGELCTPAHADFPGIHCDSAPAPQARSSGINARFRDRCWTGSISTSRCRALRSRS